MSISPTQYQAIMRTYEETQLHNRRLLEQRRQEVYRKADSYRALEDSIAGISVSQGKKLLEGDSHALDDLRDTLSTLRDMKKQLLLGAGFSADYLEPIYTCPDCRDTGYLENREKCHCFKQKLITLLYDQSNLKEMLAHENFSTLSDVYYQGEDLVRFQNAVKTCRNFASNFKKDYHNLLLYGTVGTGKSFLSGCIAKELLDAGHSVIYFSAAALFDLLSTISFEHNRKQELTNRYQDLYNCDLLIIDDLGTEMATSFLASQLFSCLNERVLHKKSTLISTNLSLEELRDRYSERVFSRLTQSFTMCKLTGPDIRMLKKIYANRK